MSYKIIKDNSYCGDCVFYKGVNSEYGLCHYGLYCYNRKRIHRMCHVTNIRECYICQNRIRSICHVTSIRDCDYYGTRELFKDLK